MNGKTLDFVLMSFVRLSLPSCLGKSKQSIYFHLSMILRETSTGSQRHKLYLLHQTPPSPSTYVGRLCVCRLREAALTWFLGATLRNFLTPRSVLKIMTGSSNNFPTSHLHNITIIITTITIITIIVTTIITTPAPLRPNPKDHAWIILPPPVEQQLSNTTFVSAVTKQVSELKGNICKFDFSGLDQEK